MFEIQIVADTISLDALRQWSQEMYGGIVKAKEIAREELKITKFNK